MPNRGAKDRKARRQKLNTKWAREGRTANQNKKWKAKQQKTNEKTCSDSQAP